MIKTIKNIIYILFGLEILIVLASRVSDVAKEAIISVIESLGIVSLIFAIPPIGMFIILFSSLFKYKSTSGA